MRNCFAANLFCAVDNVWGVQIFQLGLIIRQVLGVNKNPKQPITRK